MKRLQLILEQLEECKRLILMGGVPQLRMSLLLSDNATEILMRRTVKDHFVYSGWGENLARALEELPPHPDAEFVASIYRSIIPADQKKKIEKFFDQKVKFLSVDRDVISKSIASALSSVHRYRNAAHHSEKLHKDSIKPIALLSFEIATELLIVLSQKSLSIKGEEDYSWIKRFGLDDVVYGIDDPALIIVRDTLRNGLPLEVDTLKSELVVHLHQRLKDIFKEFDYLIDSCSLCKTKEDAFKFSQCLATLKPKREIIDHDKLLHYVPKYFLRDLQNWEEEVRCLAQIENKLDLFSEFSRLDRELEPHETLVHDAVITIDGAVQSAIDEARGK